MEDQQALEIATRAAFRGGRIALARMGDPGSMTWKGHRDLVTEASFEVQNAILDVLQKECPGDGFLAEEGPDDEPLAVDAERLWIIDPICGTLNFAQGIPFFAISIALRVSGQLRVGVVYDPVRDETFAARFGDAATVNKRAINVIPVALGPEFWEQAWIATDLPLSGRRRYEALQVFELFADQVTTQNVMGSPALAMCYVAAGRIHAYWTLDAKPWDVAAALVILAQAGALITDAEGGAWILSDGSYLAANPATHQWALRGLKYVHESNKPPE